MITYEFRRLTAGFILDLVDELALGRGLRGSRPRPLGPVRAFLVASTPTGGVRRAFARPPELVLVRNPSGFDLGFGEAILPDGSRRTLPMPDGDYEVRVESPYYQARVVTVAIPRPADPPTTLLRPGYAYPFPAGTTLLRGTVQATDGEGEAGASVTASGLPDPYATDESGQWALAFDPVPASLRVRVTYRRPGGGVESAVATLAAGLESSLRATALRGLVLVGGAGASGATIDVGGPRPAVATRSDGTWTYAFGIAQPSARVDVTAALADGRKKTVPRVAVTPGATNPVPTFRF